MAKEFLSLGVTTTVTQRHDFFGLFAGQANQSGERAEVTTYYLDDWRKKAMELTTPTINLMCNAHLQTLRAYQQWATQSYRSHISDLIRDKTDESELLLGMLSGEEVVMRDHVDWLKEFKSQLQHIKRG